MKDFFKYVGLLVVGLFVAVILYPFLHEAGHSVVAILVGAKVLDFNLLPIPYVMCDVSRVSALGRVMIGLGGIIMPIVLVISINAKKFWIWYTLFLVKSISLFATFLSFIATILYNYGISMDNEDIVQILKIFPNGLWIFVVVLGLMIMCCIIAMKKEKPFLRCLDYFDVTENKTILNH